MAIYGYGHYGVPIPAIYTAEHENCVPYSRIKLLSLMLLQPICMELNFVEKIHAYSLYGWVASLPSPGSNIEATTITTKRLNRYL